MDINHNQSECVVMKTSFLETTYHNICNGTVHTIPNTPMEIMLAFLFVFVVVIVVAAVVSIAWQAVTE